MIELWNNYAVVIITIIIYIIGATATLEVDTALYNWNSRINLSNHRKVTSKDVWIAAMWPLYFIWTALKSTLYISHAILSTLLLLFFIPYKYSNIYEKINKFLD